MASKRKLFVTHAGELAHRLVQAVGRGGLVERFVRSYAERHNRKAMLGDAMRMHELESTIGREALLVMAADLHRRIPRAIASRQGVALRPEEAAFSEAFFAEFLASLCRALVSSYEEARVETEGFRRDLHMYMQWTQRPAGSGPVGAADSLTSPFPDRCALLLDPSMMETARRAAADFESEIVRLGARIFAQLGRHSVHRPRKKSSPRKVKRQRRAAKQDRKRSRNSSLRVPSNDKKKSRRPPKSQARRRRG